MLIYLLVHVAARIPIHVLIHVAVHLPIHVLKTAGPITAHMTLHTTSARLPPSDSFHSNVHQDQVKKLLFDHFNGHVTIFRLKDGITFSCQYCFKHCPVRCFIVHD